MQTSRQFLVAVSLCAAAVQAHGSPTRLGFGTAVSADGHKRITLREPQTEGDNQARVQVDVKLSKGRHCSYAGVIGSARAVEAKPIQAGEFTLPVDPGAHYRREVLLQLPQGSHLGQCQLNFGSAPQGFDIHAKPLDPKAANARSICNQFCGAQVNLSGRYTFR